MKSENKEVRINLIAQPKELIEKIFSEWAVNFGRIIIVLTELIALSALGYRFYIDRQIIDLHQKIKSKESIISSPANKKKEAEFRDIQARLTAAYTYATKTDTATKVLQNVFEQTNTSNFIIEQIGFSNNNISLNGSVFSMEALNNFVVYTKEIDEVQSVSVGNIKSGDNAIEFDMTITIL